MAPIPGTLTQCRLFQILETSCNPDRSSEIFFPRRVVLNIDGRSYSPKILEKALYCVASQPAFHLASEALSKVGGIEISGRHPGNLSELIGQELANESDTKKEAYFDQMLPRVLTDPSPPIHLAALSVDGGRIQTRTHGVPSGVQDPHWRETKDALFMRMSGVSFEQDPHPQLPGLLQQPQFHEEWHARSRKIVIRLGRREGLPITSAYMESLVKEIGYRVKGGADQAALGLFQRRRNAGALSFSSIRTTYKFCLTN